MIYNRLYSNFREPPSRWEPRGRSLLRDYSAKASYAPLNLSHTSLAKLFDDLVVANGLADHACLPPDLTSC